MLASNVKHGSRLSYLGKVAVGAGVHLDTSQTKRDTSITNYMSSAKIEHLAGKVVSVPMGGGDVAQAGILFISVMNSLKVKD